MSEVLFKGIHDLSGKERETWIIEHRTLKKRQEATEYGNLRFFKFLTLSIFILVRINSEIALAM